MKLRIYIGVVLGGFFVIPLSDYAIAGALMNDRMHEKPFFQFDKNVRGAGYRMVDSMVLSPNADFLVMTSHSLYAFSVATGKQLYQIRHRHKKRGFTSAVFGKDNQRFACYCDDEGVQIRDVKTGRVLRTVANGAIYSDGNFGDNGTLLVALERRNPTVMTLWDWRDPKPRLRIRRDPPADPDRVEAYPIAYSPDGRVIATGGFQCPFETWDLGSGKRLRRFTGRSPKMSWVTFAPDGKTIATVSDCDETISLWDAVSGKPKRRLRVGITIPEGGGRVFNHICYSPDGKVLACCGWSPLIHRLDAHNGKALPSIDTKEHAVDRIVFTPDGKRLFSGGPSGIRLWDLATRTEIRKTIRK